MTTPPEPEINNGGAMLYKQPHEGITGTDRADGVLGLTEEAVAVREALAGLARHFYSAILVGNPAPAVARMWERVKEPQIGDLVLEQTSGWRGFSPQSMGFLIEKRTEWWQTDEEWAETKAEEEYEDDSERPTDEAWYVQYGPAAADICRWTNSMFYVLPLDRREFSKPAGTPNANGGVTITRDSLLDSLADTGFNLRGLS